MKKLFLLAMGCFMAAITVSAQPQKYYYLYFEGQEDMMVGSWIIVDREKMQCVYDGDSDGTAIIKNYKKVGNKETFAVYDKNDPTMLIENFEIVTTETKTTITRIYKEHKTGPIVVGDEKQRDAHHEKVYGKKSSGTPAKEQSAEVPKNPADKAKGKVTGGVKKVFNKGKDLFKKK